MYSIAVYISIDIVYIINIKEYVIIMSAVWFKLYIKLDDESVLKASEYNLDQKIIQEISLGYNMHDELAIDFVTFTVYLV